jgi:hypothetical protein
VRTCPGSGRAGPRDARQRARARAQRKLIRTPVCICPGECDESDLHRRLEPSHLNSVSESPGMGRGRAPCGLRCSSRRAGPRWVGLKGRRGRPISGPTRAGSRAVSESESGVHRRSVGYSTAAAAAPHRRVCGGGTAGSGRRDHHPSHPSPSHKSTAHPHLEGLNPAQHTQRSASESVAAPRCRRPALAARSTVINGSVSSLSPRSSLSHSVRHRVLRPSLCRGRGEESESSPVKSAST